MKSRGNLLCSIFTIAYAVVFSMGSVCLLNLMGMAFALSLDGGSVVSRYPRFIPFCIAVLILSVATFVMLVILSFEAREKLNYTKVKILIQSLISFVMSVPMMYLWNALFKFLQERF